MPIAVMHRSGTRKGGGFPTLSVPIAHHWDAAVGVTEATGGVSSWVDKVGGADADQVTETRRPALTAGSLGGHPTIDFDGIDNALGVGSFAAIPQPFTIYVILKNWVDNLVIADIWNSNSNVARVVMIGTGGKEIRLQAPNAVASGYTVPVGNATLGAVFSGASSVLYENAIAGTVHDAGAQGADTLMTIGAGSPAGLTPAQFSVAEYVIFGGAINQADADALQNYAEDKYNHGVPFLSSPMAHLWDGGKDVTVGTGGVSSWVDQVGAEDLIQATEAQRPGQAFSFPRGKSAIRFDGVNDVLASAALGAIAQPYSVFLVVDEFAASGTNSHLFRNVLEAVRARLSPAGLLNITAPNSADTGHTVDTDVHSLGVVFSGAASFAYLDALASGVLSVGVNALGGEFLVGALDSAGAAGFNGDILEIQIYSGALAQADIDKLHAYAAAKFKI